MGATGFLILIGVVALLAAAYGVGLAYYTWQERRERRARWARRTARPRRRGRGALVTLQSAGRWVRARRLRPPNATPPADVPARGGAVVQFCPPEAERRIDAKRPRMHQPEPTVDDMVARAERGDR